MKYQQVKNVTCEKVIWRPKPFPWVKKVVRELLNSKQDSIATLFNCDTFFGLVLWRIEFLWFWGAGRPVSWLCFTGMIFMNTRYDLFEQWPLRLNFTKYLVMKNSRGCLNARVLHWPALDLYGYYLKSIFLNKLHFFLLRNLLYGWLSNLSFLFLNVIMF